ncbi:MAG: 3-deoxy-D-manno-octulosonic acid transferase [Paracoccaceae bacterium]
MVVYRIILFLIAPLVMGALLLRRLRGTESWQQIGERLGSGTAPSDDRPVIWVHGASLGEMTAARPVIEQLIAEIARLQIVVTVNTVTAREMVLNWKIPAITVHLAPLDYAIVMRRFFGNWRPLAAITLENEIWPVRMQICGKLAIPVVILSGRISQKALRKWSRHKAFAQKLFGTVGYLAPMDKENGVRFLQLGLSPDRLGREVNLKSAVTLESAKQTLLVQMQKVFTRSKTYLAASTHEGDEALILSAFTDALKHDKTLKLILAPRHPHRGEEISGIIENMGLSYSRRSLGQEPNNADAVYLVDTLGEMPLWYSLAKATIIGGSFSDKGGHTPVEPVQFKSIVVHGPDVTNHRDAFAALHGNNAAIEVENAADLQKIFENPDLTLGLGNICQRARDTVQELRADTSDTREFVDKIKSIIESNY